MGIKSYQDLVVWQRSHKAALKIFILYKRTKKTSATYEIWKQGLDAAFSVPANIVEGFHAHRGKNFISKLEISRGEAAETGYWVLVLKEIHEIEENQYKELSQEYLEIVMMLTSLIQKNIALYS